MRGNRDCPGNRRAKCRQNKVKMAEAATAKPPPGEVGGEKLPRHPQRTPLKLVERQ